MARTLEDQVLNKIMFELSVEKQLLQMLCEVYTGQDLEILHQLKASRLPLPYGYRQDLLRLYLAQLSDEAALVYIQRSLTGRTSSDVKQETDDPDGIWLTLCQQCNAYTLRVVVYRYVQGLLMREVAGLLGYAMSRNRTCTAIVQHTTRARRVVGEAGLLALRRAAIWKPGTLVKTRLDTPPALEIEEMEDIRLNSLRQEPKTSRRATAVCITPPRPDPVQAAAGDIWYVAALCMSDAQLRVFICRSLRGLKTAAVAAVLGGNLHTLKAVYNKAQAKVTRALRLGYGRLDSSHLAGEEGDDLPGMEYIIHWQTQPEAPITEEELRSFRQEVLAHSPPDGLNREYIAYVYRYGGAKHRLEGFVYETAQNIGVLNQEND